MVGAHWRSIVTAWIWAALACVQGAAAEPPPLPPRLFFEPAAIDRAALSPSGRWLALTTSLAGDRVQLVVFDLREWGKPSQAAAFADADIRRFEWVDDQRLVFEVIDLASGGGDQRFAPGLFSVRRDGTELRTLVRLRRESVTGARAPGREPLEWNHRLLHVPADGSGEVIVGEWSFAADGELRDVTPKRLNVTDLRVRSLALGTPPGTRHWLFDVVGQPRVVLAGGEGRNRLYWKPPRQDEWLLLSDHPRYAAPFLPRFIDAAGDLYVQVAAGGGGTSELRRFDFERRTPTEEALVRTPGFDFDGHLVAETVGGRSLGVRLRTDAETTVWWDAGLRTLQAEADRRWPGRINRLDCRRCGERDQVTLLLSYADRDPGTYLVHRAETGAWQVIGRRHPDIDPARMATLDFHRIRARDGLELPVWVTTPAGRAEGPRPAVVLVHGGPWMRGGDWRWSPMAQFLASRGYVVIEPEFRGSRGFGDAHFRAGIRQWGLAMQDDLADALQWAVDRRLADPRRVCIAGASYGGYATLMGLARHPELYRCGAAWVAVTDPRLMFRWTFISDQSDEFRRFDLPLLLGDPVKDAEQLRATAPVELADRIRAPVLLAVGGQDRRVPLEHGTRMRDALRDAGRPPEWIVYPDEGHGWLTLRTRVDFAERLEGFLARYLASP